MKAAGSTAAMILVGCSGVRSCVFCSEHITLSDVFNVFAPLVVLNVFSGELL